MPESSWTIALRNIDADVDVERTCNGVRLTVRHVTAVTLSAEITAADAAALSYALADVTKGEEAEWQEKEGGGR